MKFIITENKLYGAVSKFMSNEFDKLYKFKSKIFPTGIFYINDSGNIIAEVVQTEHMDGIILEWEVWKSISDFFGFETIREQQDAISNWADQYFGFKNTLIDFREFVETIDDL